MNTITSSPFAPSTLRRIAQTVALFSLVGVYFVFAAGCDLLPQPDDEVQCDLTGIVVGVDGEAPTQLDVAWYPDTELASSVEILEVNTQGNTFQVTSLKVSPDDQNVQGELRIDEIPSGINPKRYDPVFIAIDLPRNGCNEDFGTIELPLFGTTDTNNGTSGTNNGTSTSGTNNDTSGTNNGTSGTNNGTSGTSTTSETGETGENNGTSTGGETGETSENNETSTSGTGDDGE